MAMSRAEIEAIFPDQRDERSVEWRDTEHILFACDNDLPPHLQKKLFETDEEWHARLKAAGIEHDDYTTALKIAVAAQRDQGDPLGMDAYIRSELAIAVIAAMWGRNLNKIRIEESKAEPNATVLKELNDKQALYHKEKDEVYRGNIAVQEHVIRDYAPLLKNEFDGI